MYKQLFFDDQKLLLRDNLKREYGRPEVIPESVYRDAREIQVTSMWKAPDGKYHLFYFGVPAEDDPEALENFEPGGVVLAAISDDGIHFKPRNTALEAGIKNPKCPNQVIDYFDGEFCSLFVDEKAEKADERLKILIADHDNDNCHLCCDVYVSGDGIHWRKKAESCWNSFGAECGMACYNPIRRKYLIATRPDGGDRRIAINETSDWLNFSETMLCMQCDSSDPVLTELYGMAPFYYDGMMISFLWIYTTDTTQHRTKFQGGRITGQLAYSFNGIHWQRSLREDFISGKNDTEILGYENNMVYANEMHRDKNGDILILTHASKGEHGAGFRTKGACASQIYKLREDGFITLKTEDESKPSLICTRDNLWKGGELSINIACKNATVALYDRDNTLYDGYSHEDCIPFSGDSKKWIPAWKDSKTLDMLKNEIVQIEIKFEDGTLYSLSGNYSPMMDLGSHRAKYLGFDCTRKGF